MHGVIRGPLIADSFTTFARQFVTAPFLSLFHFHLIKEVNNATLFHSFPFLNTSSFPLKLLSNVYTVFYFI